MFSRLSNHEKLEILFALLNDLRKEKRDISIPVSIFTKRLGSLEAIVKYLREELNLSNIKVSRLLKRDNKVTWNIYSKARKKFPLKLDTDSDIFIPVSIFAVKKFSVLESLVAYLKEKEELRFVDIAGLLHRNQRTIWTVYQKYKEKRANAKG